MKSIGKIPNWILGILVLVAVVLTAKTINGLKSVTKFLGLVDRTSKENKKKITAANHEKVERVKGELNIVSLPEDQSVYENIAVLQLEIADQGLFSFGGSVKKAMKALEGLNKDELWAVYAAFGVPVDGMDLFGFYRNELDDNIPSLWPPFNTTLEEMAAIWKAKGIDILTGSPR